MISDAIEVDPWRAALHAHGRVQIPDYLQPEAAQRLRECLQREVPWTLALRDEAGPRTIAAADYATLAPDALAALLRSTAESARGGAYRFAYDSYMMVTAYKERRDPGLLHGMRWCAAWTSASSRRWRGSSTGART